MGLQNILPLCDSAKYLQMTTASFLLDNFGKSDDVLSLLISNLELQMIFVEKSVRDSHSQLHFHLVLVACDEHWKSCGNKCNENSCQCISCHKSSVNIDRKYTLYPPKGFDNSHTIANAVPYLNNPSALCVKTLLTGFGDKMDLLRTPSGLRKKSSLLWNSLRLPRKHKGEWSQFYDDQKNRCRILYRIIIVFTGKECRLNAGQLAD